MANDTPTDRPRFVHKVTKEGYAIFSRFPTWIFQEPLKLLDMNV